MNSPLKGSHFIGMLSVAGMLGGCVADHPWETDTDSKGKILLSLSADGDVESAKPSFRSGENEFSSSDYLTVPSANEFKIKLEKNDGSSAQIWSSISEFNKESETSSDFPFQSGTYTLTAYYCNAGKNKGDQGFDAPYFEASTQVTVLSDKLVETSMTATLQNSMVVIDYTDAFKNYMSDWTARIRTEGNADEITYAQNETRAAFIEPGKTSVYLHFTPKGINGNTPKPTQVSLGEFNAAPRSLYHITFDLTGEDTATLSVHFDDDLTEEPVYIDLTEELLTTQAPAITTTGFSNGQTLDMLANTASENPLKMTVQAYAGIKSAKLTIDSSYTPSWGSEIDLCTAGTDKQDALTYAGIAVTGLYKNPDKMATIDFTNFGKSLPKGTHTISLKVEDRNGAVSETCSFTINSEEIVLTHLPAYDQLYYGTDEATIAVSYNGKNPDTAITFTATDAEGMHRDAVVKKFEEAASTRGFEAKTYVYTLGIPFSATNSVEIAEYLNGKKVETYKVTVSQPEYAISAIDAYANTADMMINVPGATDRLKEAVIRNLKARVISQKSEEYKEYLTLHSTDVSNGIVIFKGLTPAYTYNVETSIDGGKTWKAIGRSFTTESELSIPNGDFSNTSTPLSINSLQVGGKYDGNFSSYTITSSINLTQPADWQSINAKTAYSGATNKNTWFVVPSTWVENGVAVIRNVAFDHAGTTPASTSANPAVTPYNYYCKNAPTFASSNKVAGELFLGSYAFSNGLESRNNGIGFASRPTSISFDYTYEPIDGTDVGEAIVIITDGNGNTVYSKSETLGKTTTTAQKKINLSYPTFGQKASKLYICFKSSNQASAPVHIPSGTELQEGITTPGDKTLAANSYHALATGSVLKIDNVTAHYDRFGSASNSPKRKTSKTAKK